MIEHKDIEALVFMNKYKYVKSADFAYLYSNHDYYKKKIRFLEENKYIRKIGWYFVIGAKGKKLIESMGYKYQRLQYNNEFINRQKIISHFAAMYYNHPNIKFTPSVDIKDSRVYTNTSRKFIGTIQKNNTIYLSYYISLKHSPVYIQSIIYDIKKEKRYDNYLIFVDDINSIDISKFVFGKHKLYIIPNISENIQLFEKIDEIDYQRLFNKIYNEKTYLSGFDSCEYYINQSHYVFTMPLINPEKLSSIKYFMLENKNIKVDVIYSKNISPLIFENQKEINGIKVDYSKFILEEDFRKYE